MASLPQGWHGVSAIPRKSNTQNTFPLVQPHPRKKQPLQLKPVPLVSNGMVRNNAGSSLAQISTKAPATSTLPARINKTKEEIAELGSLKKELSRIKDENMVLRCRLRKIDDENGKKTREIERLRSATKGLSERKKELPRSTGSTNSRLPVKNKQNENAKATQSNNSKSSWKENMLHSEITRLKDIVTKLQEGNKRLEVQLKERDQEIKSLKQQLAKVPGRSTAGGRLVNKPKQLGVEKAKPVSNVMTGSITKSNRSLNHMNNGSTRIISNKVLGGKQEPVILADSVQKTDSTGKEI